jgi:hypothetical protein
MAGKINSEIGFARPFTAAQIGEAASGHAHAQSGQIRPALFLRGESFDQDNRRSFRALDGFGIDDDLCPFQCKAGKSDLPC